MIASSRRNFLSGTAAWAATAALAPWRVARAPSNDASITDDMWMEGVRKHYGGPIIVGRDLLEI